MDIEDLPLETRDREFMMIMQLISAKEAWLAKKHQELRDTSRENGLLADVLTDYRSHKETIAQQRRDQLQALAVLQEYIAGLNQEGQLSKANLDDAKAEQRKILREIKVIKRDLDGILQTLNDNQS